MAYTNHTSFTTAEQDYSPRGSLGSNSNENIMRIPFSDQLYNEKGVGFLNPTEFENHANADNDKTLISSSQINLNNKLINPHQQSPLRTSFTSEDLESSNTIFENDFKNYPITDENLSKTFNREHSYSDTIKEIDVPLFKPRTHTTAWVLLFFVVLLRAAIAMFNNTFSPIPLKTAQFLGVSLTSINWLYNVTFITFMISCFFTSWLYSVIGAKWSASN